jgi:hypothetical protein
MHVGGEGALGERSKTVVRVPVGSDSIEFNAKLVDPPDGVDEWLYNDYIFKVACR